MRRLSLLAAATLVAISSCTFTDGASEGPSIPAPTASDSSPSTVSPITSSTFDFDYCAEGSRVDDMFRSVLEGTRTDKEQMATVGRLQILVELSAQTLGFDEAAALQKLATGLGRLKDSIRAAGPNYPLNPVVRLRARSASYLAGTAAFILRCPRTSSIVI
jgi:hypothetical protein